jgi:uncharacterized protein YeaO (DUF488 family)
VADAEREHDLGEAPEQCQESNPEGHRAGPALKHLRELARSGTLTLLTATKHAEISEAAVLADLIRG